jgi:membrane-associated phospholipid phosphatase
MTLSRSGCQSGAEVAPREAGDGARGWVVPLLRQAAMVVAALVLYNWVRVLTQGSEEAAFRHARHLLDFEDGLGIAWERSAQEVVLARPHLVSFFNGVYTWAFWPTVVASLTLLYVRDRPRYLVMRDSLFISGAIGLVIFASFPVAPPRFLDGFVDTVADLSTQEVVAHPGLLVNRYAAMPSFHVGWMLLAAIVVRPALPRRPFQVIPFALAALMVATVVVTANHYIIDAAAGILVSIIGLVAAWRIDRRRTRRAAAVPAVASLAECGHDHDPTTGVVVEVRFDGAPLERPELESSGSGGSGLGPASQG